MDMKTFKLLEEILDAINDHTIEDNLDYFAEEIEKVLDSSEIDV